MNKKKKLIAIIIILTLIIILILTCFFKTNIIKTEIITRTYENNHYIVGIHYPKTNINNLDNEITNYIDLKHQNFIENYGDSDYLVDRDELNIDYQYHIHQNSYISLSLTTYINSYKINHPINEIQSFFYDTKQEKMLNLTDILDEENQTKLINKIENLLKNDYQDYILEENIDSIISTKNLKNQLFFINSESLYLYFLPENLASDYYDILTLEISLKDINFKIQLDYNTSTTTSYEIIQETSNIIDPTKKVVALTFDDGPSKYTKDIINTLKENDACATFFILGNKVEFYQDILKESLKNGNELGNHSYNHKWLSKLSVTNLKEQIESTQNIIYEKLNYKPTYLRPTYGSVTNRIRKNTNLKIALWTVDTKDWKIKDIDQIVKRATDDIEDGDIILMHDIFERSSEALKKIIPILKEEGFQFVTLSELEEVELLRTRLN